MVARSWRVGEGGGDAVDGLAEAGLEAAAAGRDGDRVVAGGDPLGGLDQAPEADPTDGPGDGRRQATPIATAVTAATTDRGRRPRPTTRSIRDSSGRGSRPRPEPRAPGPPSRRITPKGYGVGRAPVGPTGRTADACRKYGRVVDNVAPTGRSGGPAPLLYSGRPRPERVRPVNQEVSDRACMAHRPSREATERPEHSDPPKRRRRDAGDVYPSPRPQGLGLLIRAAPLDVDAHGMRLMPATVIVGLQWGDEGKGKTTDFLAEQVAMVVRYQGGDNAGHTVVSGDEVFKLRLTPSGVLYPHITSVIGNGVVVNPVTLIDELDMLDRARDRRQPRPGQPERARDHAVPRGARPGERGAARWRQGRHDRPRDRADLRRPRVAARAAHGGPARSRRSCASGSSACCRTRTSSWPGWAARPSRSDAARRRGPRLGRPPARPPRRHDLAGPGGAGAAASTSCSRARRARCSTSTTAAIRTSRRPTRSPAAPARAAGSARSRSTRSSAS